MSSKLARHNGLAIRYLRIKSGIKPGALAATVGCSYEHLNNLETERKEASPEVLQRIASALDVPIRALVRDPASLIGKDAA